MIDNEWFCEPDDHRESWCFLLLRIGDHHIIKGWEMGYGNPTALVRKLANHKSKEKEIVKELLRELYYCRKKNISLITYSSDVLLILRTRIIILEIENACLHKIKHISIERILNDYFLPDIKNSLPISNLIESIGLDIKNSHQDDSLWHLLMQIGPLLPNEVTN